MYIAFYINIYILYIKYLFYSIDKVCKYQVIIIQTPWTTPPLSGYGTDSNKSWRKCSTRPIYLKLVGIFSKRITKNDILQLIYIKIHKILL